jgi:hypothetical protein
VAINIAETCAGEAPARASTAMLSAGGALRKNHGVVVTSEKTGDSRRYSIKPEAESGSFFPAAGFSPGGLFNQPVRFSWQRPTISLTGTDHARNLRRDAPGIS